MQTALVQGCLHVILNKNYLFSWTTLTIWMMIVGINANPIIQRSWVLVNGVTANKLWRPGTNKIKANNNVPTAKAAKLYQLFLKPILKMLCCERQLKPWSKRAKVKVEKAMVHATAALVWRPIMKAAITPTEMIAPWRVTLVTKFLSRIPTLGSRGFLSRMSGAPGSIPIAKAGRSRLPSWWTKAELR